MDLKAEESRSGVTGSKMGTVVRVGEELRGSDENDASNGRLTLPVARAGVIKDELD